MNPQRGNVAPGSRSTDRPASAAPPQPARLSRGALALWLVAIGLAILLVPLYLAGATIRSEAAQMETELASNQTSLAVVPTPIPEVQQLMTTLTAVQTQAGQVDAIVPTLAAGRRDWPALMAAIGNYDPRQIELTSLTQAGNQLTLDGRALDDTVVVNYARSLEQSGFFSRVVVQSIRVVATPQVTLTGTPAITPTASVTPTLTHTPTATPTPTPDPRDAYELDDVLPKPIALGQPQLHNFYPAGDIDTASFLAKAGRYYRIYTTDLMPGVDTSLTLSAGGSSFTNDDARPGSLSSEIVFQNAAGQDNLAFIRVSNRGQYGPDQWYLLVVEEIVPTPTGTFVPSPTPTHTPTSTPTATPTHTPTPTNSPTATTDARDVYEPDDSVPRPIAIGETQTHSFYPDGDIDKVSYVAKAGRYYQVLTSDLAVGVDTVLAVGLGSQQWENDDYDPGSGNYASAVCFQAPLEGTAVVTITNFVRQYGPARTYKVSVAEIPDLNTPPCRSFTPATVFMRAQGLAAPRLQAAWSRRSS